MTAPAWLPDWKVPEAYPKPSMSLHGWAWQFFRRSPVYQMAWDAVAQSFPAVLLSGWSASATSATAYVSLDSCSMNALTRAGEPFGLRQLVDPAHRSLTGSMGWKGIGTLFLKSIAGLQTHFDVTVQPNEIDIRFNLDQPLAKQLEGAKWVIKHMAQPDFEKKHDPLIIAGLLASPFKQFSRARPASSKHTRARAPRARRKLFPGYLRILDAKEAGATHHEMKSLFGNAVNLDDKVRNSLDQAVRMRDDGYRDLLVIIDP